MHKVVRRVAGEVIDVGLCRVRGMPEPSREVVRQTPGGRIYLDVGWEEFDLVVEIDGAQHQRQLDVMRDILRKNDVTLSGDRVLRIDVVGLRPETGRFLDQVVRGLVHRRAA